MTSLARANRIYEQALNLPTEDRMVLIDKLLHSANLPTQLEIDKLWADEVERRCRDIEEGKAKLIPGEVVLKKIRKRFAK